MTRRGVDATPHLVTGAVIGVCVKRPTVALSLAVVSHFVLDAIPHFHIVWITGRALYEAIDLGLGILLVAVIAWRAGQLWPLAGGLVAVLPDVPGVKGIWEGSLSGLLPHPIWPPPWGILTQIVVAGLAFLWGMKKTAVICHGSRPREKNHVAAQ